MIEWHTDEESIFEQKTAAIVIPVNTLGVMGAGLALQAARKWPAGAADYQLACRQKTLVVGGVLSVLSSPPASKCGPEYILYAATKADWRKDSKLAWVESCLIRLADISQKLELESISIPALGCGLGHVRWIYVKPLFELYFDHLDVSTHVFPPQ